MNTRLFEIKAIAFGRLWERDVNCPSEWRGSGVYDEDHPAWQNVRIEVAAPCMEDALKFAEEEYKSGEWDFQVDGMWFQVAEDKGNIEWEKRGIIDFEEGKINNGIWHG